MAGRITTQDVRGWQAYFVLQNSDANPDITEWDDFDSAKRKQQRKAEAKARMRS